MQTFEILRPRVDQQRIINIEDQIHSFLSQYVALKTLFKIDNPAGTCRLMCITPLMECMNIVANV